MPSFSRIEPKDTAVKPHPQSLGYLIYRERQHFRRLECIDNGRVGRPRQAQLTVFLFFGQDRAEPRLRAPGVPRQIRDATRQREEQDERCAHERYEQR